ncbi:MAG: lmo0937 family membrane protein [Candidatus Nomurabacteria bacterium]|nr:lmo0937 family membrane protein [Candidatus Nomurabacteria bacterium]
MLTIIGFVLIFLWLVGFIGFHVVGGFIHILLVIAVVLFLIRIIRGENPLK